MRSMSRYFNLTCQAVGGGLCLFATYVVPLDLHPVFLSAWDDVAGGKWFAIVASALCSTVCFTGARLWGSNSSGRFGHSGRSHCLTTTSYITHRRPNMTPNLQEERATSPTADAPVIVIGAALYLLMLVMSLCVTYMAVTVPSSFEFAWTLPTFIELIQFLFGLPAGVWGIGCSAYGTLQVIRTRQVWNPPGLRREKP